MASDYVESSLGDAEEIAKTLQQVDALLGSDKLNQLYQGDAAELRKNVRKMLVNIKTDLEALSNLEKDDPFKTDPTLANQRYKLIKNIETAKIDFEFEIVPALEKLTRQVVETSKQNPPEQVNEETLPPPPPGEKWTVQKVLDTASQFVEQAARAGAIFTKAYTLAKALGLVLGIPIP
ncbi:MAG: hypothetical protein OHK0041_14180 [Anaerolineales bacterium]